MSMGAHGRCLSNNYYSTKLNQAKESLDLLRNSASPTLALSDPVNATTAITTTSAYLDSSRSRLQIPMKKAKAR
ncbi:hypothetical protein LTR40_010197, partial [Exophiala xenobiotica]